MPKKVLHFLFALFAGSAVAAELTFDLNKYPLNAAPTSFLSIVTGEGKAGDWKIIEGEIPSALAPLSPNAPKIGQRPVLAQLSQDPADEHFPLLIFNDEIFRDFTFSTRFKCVSGEVEQMAGIAFRIQDEKNYYVLRASALGHSFRFYKFVNGVRSAPIGPDISIPKNVWQEMAVECKGNQIRCWLNGAQAMPTLTDNSFSSGKLGFWTKSDAVSYFVDAKINYVPRVPLAQKVIDEMLHRYPRVVGLKIFATNHVNELRVIASNDKAQIGDAGAKGEAAVFTHGKMLLAKDDETIAVLSPLKDRNGDVVAVLRVTMKSFKGQTDKNALARSTPIAKAIEARILSAKDLLE